MLERLRRSLDAVRGRIADACARARRRVEDVTLVVVTKTVGAEVVDALARLGVEDVGENYVQDARRKKESATSAAQKMRWHMIGHLQRNKAKRAVEIFDCVHSVDGLGIVEALDRRARAAGRTMPVFVEVKLSGEATKFGVAPDEAEAVAEAVAAADGLELLGLMTMAPHFEDPERARRYFAALRSLGERLDTRLGGAIRYYSMGMSSDFEVAVEEGATHVRIGTAVVGGLVRC